MLHTLAIENYRSLLKLIIPLGQLNIVTGKNGSGKSNLYRALWLLAETARGGVVNSLAQEGGLKSTFWAGPESLSRRMKNGEVPIQGGINQKAKRLRLGFASDTLSYAISMGMGFEIPSSAFALDPEIKEECIWAGNVCRPASILIERQGAFAKSKIDKKWQILNSELNAFESIFSQIADPAHAPEIFYLREQIRSWRFYDHFRTDQNAPVRCAQLGTRTPILSHDGHDLAAALQTIHEIGDSQALEDSINDAFPGSSLRIEVQVDGRFALLFNQKGLLRPLSISELSEGTLRYLLWVAALHTPRPPEMMVLNEPENSLHPDLLPALTKLIIKASTKTQILVVTHSAKLITGLSTTKNSMLIELEKNLGQTTLAGQDLSNQPSWHWGV